MNYRFTIINDTVETVIDEPIGWDKCKFTLARDENYHGIFVTFSTDLEFVNDGYTIITNAFYNEGIEKVLLLRIEERCNESYEYEIVFTGRINLARYQDLFNGYCSCKANLEDSNDNMLIKNNSDKLINLSTELIVEDATLAALTPNVMTMHSKELLLTSTWESTYEQVLTGLVAFSGGAFINLPILLIQDDTSNASSNTFTYEYGNSLSDISKIYDSGSTTGDITFNIDFTITDFSFRILDADATYNVDIIIANNTDERILKHLFTTVTGAAIYTYSGSIIVSTDEIFTLTENDIARIYIRFTKIGGGNLLDITQVQYKITSLNIYAVSVSSTAQSTASTYLIHEAFERVAQATLDKSDAFESNFFGRKDIGYGANGCGSFTALTNGFNIRAFEKPVFLTLSDVFNSLSAVFCLGLGIENDKIKVEPIDYFYDSDTEILQTLNIKQITVTSNENLIHNTALIGFAKYGTEDGTDKQNVLDGFATQHNYNFPITTVKKVFTKISNFIADHYSIEFTRRQQYLDTSTSSWKYDDDNFIICTNRTEDIDGIATDLDIAEKNENFAVTNNILSPETGYNLRLTPTRMLLKWSQLISGVYSKTVGNSIKFVNGISNYLYQSQLNGNCTDRYNNQLLSENQNLAWDDANNQTNAPIIEPISIKYTYPLNSLEFANIVSNPNGYISASKSGTIEHRGFIKMLTFTPTTGLAEFDLIRMFGNESQCDLVYVECPYVESEYVE